MVAAAVLIGAVGSASAADEWFVLGEQTIKAADQGVEIKSEGGRWTKDVKQMKMSVEGADVELTKVVLQWDNRRDDTMTDLGVLKAGGTTTPKDAPGRKGRLTAVTVQYKIVGDALRPCSKSGIRLSGGCTPTGAPARNPTGRMLWRHLPTPSPLLSVACRSV